MVANIIVGAVILAIVGGIVYARIRARKLGKSGCGSCAGCPSEGACHPK